ncbi:right-handed parallel beta-helix repeat-containing protein [Eubacterium oxidoreducens]|uniref:Right handed beta helix region n=1 Tax=Eubacterium oxidoreducens TaxID=1732 RepID=A0A1G6AEW1_EUBOX|nr:right-handed parallel beta-helix repeat-containing protein [Eubacterium oxidoreducens]SDB06957.1 Right handed beta helix region [Eubacterium oxidoreducens]
MIVTNKKWIFYGLVCALAMLCIFLLNKPQVTAQAATTYYVSTSGDNRQSGSKAHPFQTIQYGISQLSAGDTLLIKGGTYYETLKVPKKIHGKKNARITIANAPGERAIISGKNASSYESGPTLLSLNGTSYITIRGLEFTDASGQNACGIYIAAGTHHFKIAKNRIHDIIVQDPTTKDRCANGILLFGDSAKYSIHDGTISANTLYRCTTGWAECLSVTGNVKKITIHKNTLRNIGNIGIDLSGNYGYCKKASLDFPRNCKITANKVYRCISPNATSYGIYIDGGQKILIKNNVVKGCQGGIEIGAEQKPTKEKYSTSHITVTGNKLSGNLEAAMAIGGYEKKLGWVTQVSITKNICKNNGTNDTIVALSKCKNITFTQNTFYNKTGSAAIFYNEMSRAYTKNLTFSQNKYGNKQCYFVLHNKEYTSFAKWKKATKDKNSKVVK